MVEGTSLNSVKQFCLIVAQLVPIYRERHTEDTQSKVETTMNSGFLGNKPVELIILHR
jgi:hypothetical protein